MDQPVDVWVQMIWQADAACRRDPLPIWLVGIWVLPVPLLIISSLQPVRLRQEIYIFPRLPLGPGESSPRGRHMGSRVPRGLRTGGPTTRSTHTHHLHRGIQRTRTRPSHDWAARDPPAGALPVGPHPPPCCFALPVCRISAAAPSYVHPTMHSYIPLEKTMYVLLVVYSYNGIRCTTATIHEHDWGHATINGLGKWNSLSWQRQRHEPTVHIGRKRKKKKGDDDSRWSLVVYWYVRILYSHHFSPMWTLPAESHTNYWFYFILIHHTTFAVINIGLV